MISRLYGPPLSSGAPAPGFTLADDSGRTWSLDNLRGRWVILVFYPGDSTPICTRQLCSLRDDWEEFADLGVQVFGVNPRGKESHARFREKHRFPFPLLIDAGARLAGAYRAGGWLVVRTVYIIGPDGIIRWARRGVPTTGEMLAVIEGRM
ncbi:MAG: peroxiredoxin [Bryobacterales bacterium]|nr:peroxiredoxin [Bryobacterales bacterium]